MYNLIDLTDKTIVVTGASSGIGRQTAITISELGGKVVCIARREDRLIETVSMLEGEGHGYYAFDLSSLDEIAGLFKRIKQDVGMLDGLVYAAGIAKDGPLNVVTPNRIKEVFDTNFFAFIECARWACKNGYYNSGMSVVAFSSVISGYGGKGQLTYASAKAAINSAVKCMAVELAPKGIRVNAVVPGMINTEMYQEFLNIVGGTGAPADQKLKKRQYLGIGEPQDVANSVVYLLSDAAKFITGICMPIDGGYTSN